MVLADPENDTQVVVDGGVGIKRQKKEKKSPDLGSCGVKKPPPTYEEMSTENTNSWLRVSENRIIIIRVGSRGAKCIGYLSVYYLENPLFWCP